LSTVAIAGADRALREMRPVVVDDAAGLATLGARSAALVAVRADHAGLGLLALLDGRAGRFTRTDPQLLQALGIAVARALESTATQAATDAVPAPIGSRTGR